MKKNFSIAPVPGRKWTIAIRYGSRTEQLRILPVKAVRITNEKHDSVMLSNPDCAPWCRTRLKMLVTSECTAGYALQPGSLVLKDAGGRMFEPGKDYEINEEYGTFMRTADGRIREGEPVFASYSFFHSRLDSIVLAEDGVIIQRLGDEDMATPAPPPVQPGEKRLANIYFSGHPDRISGDMIFPVLTNRLPVSPSQTELMPKTVAKLKSGKKVRILVWGDSVTECSYLPEKEHYQTMFLKRLRSAYPKADIEMRTLGWGGRSTTTFLNEPPGSPYNFMEQVVAWEPDLVVSEFVNDGGFTPEMCEKNYGTILDAFRGNGIEWLILTPHYIKLSWMGLTSQKNCSEDPRYLVRFLRKFGKENRIAVADGSLKYGHLWENGIPFMSYMVNTINHPDRRGMKLFADALIEAMTEN